MDYTGYSNFPDNIEPDDDAQADDIVVIPIGVYFMGICGDWHTGLHATEDEARASMVEFLAESAGSDMELPF